MKFYRIILLLLILWGKNHNGFCQTENGQLLFLDSIEKYEVINDHVYALIDTVNFYTQKQGFAYRSKDYCFRINFYKNQSIVVESLPLSTINLKYWLYDHQSVGFFYYKDYLVLIGDNNNKAHFLFKNTKLSYPVFYKNSENIQDHFYYPGMSVAFEWKDNIFQMTDNVFDISSSANEYRFIYFIKKDDSKESIALKCRCPVDKLFTEKDLLPSEGFLIIVNYHFEDGKLIDVYRVQ